MWSFVKIGIFHEPFSILYHYQIKVSSDLIKILLQYLIKKSLDSRGGSSVYYKKQKEKQYAAHKDIAVRKLKAMEEKENEND